MCSLSKPQQPEPDDLWWGGILTPVMQGGEMAFVDLFAWLGGRHLPFFYQTESTLRRTFVAEGVASCWAVYGIFDESCRWLFFKMSYFEIRSKGEMIRLDKQNIHFAWEVQPPPIVMVGMIGGTWTTWSLLLTAFVSLSSSKSIEVPIVPIESVQFWNLQLHEFPNPSKPTLFATVDGRNPAPPGMYKTL